MRDDHIPVVLLDEIADYVSRASSLAEAAKTACAADRSICDIWFDPSCDCVVIRSTAVHPPKQSPDTKLGGLETVYLNADTDLPDPTWCGLALSLSSEPKGGYFAEARRQIKEQLTERKTAESNNDPATLRDRLISLTGWNNRYYPTSPIAAMLATGLLGGGLTYGGASLASLLLPDDWDKKKFRRAGAALGTAVGAIPGAWEAFGSYSVGQPLLDGSHMRLPPKHAGYDIIPPMPYQPGPQMNAEELMRAVWHQPEVKNQLSPAERSLFTGAVNSTQQIAGSPYITPADMGRLTAGMGVGYASGLIAGKVLGSLIGLPPAAQKTLANSGMYAGAVKSVVPMLYGIR
jgi:hypothetical protein